MRYRCTLELSKRVIAALYSLADEYIQWPKPRERRELCRKVKEQYGYHWVFSVNGTTHNFAFVPSYNRNSWYDRKSNYSMQALVTIDFELKVIHLTVGWPGSAHDTSVQRSADFMDPAVVQCVLCSSWERNHTKTVQRIGVRSCSGCLGSDWKRRSL